jgi:hypothetical protein
MGDFYDQKKIILVTFGVILLISAFFLPTVVLYPAKVISITPDAEVVGASAWSMLLGIGGTVMLAVALFVPAMIERQLKAWLLSAAVALIGLSAIIIRLGIIIIRRQKALLITRSFLCSHQLILGKISIALKTVEQ